jgi:predicted transcriptional regulator
MRHSIVTEKIARRGVRVVGEYVADYLDQVLVHDYSARKVMTLRATDTLDVVRGWIARGEDGSSQQGFPVVDEEGRIVGVVTRRDLLGAQRGAATIAELISRPPALIYDDCSLRDADNMARHGVGRLRVVTLVRPHAIVGIITRSDLVAAHSRRLEEQELDLPARRAGRS